MIENRTDIIIKRFDVLNEKILMFDQSQDLNDEQNTIIQVPLRKRTRKT